MSGMNKFWKGIAWGAIAGGALSLLNKETRQAVTASCKTATGNISYVMKNPGKISDQVKTTANKLRMAVEDVTEDLTYIADKVEELRSVTPQVTDILKETKEAFTKNGTMDANKNELVIKNDSLIEIEQEDSIKI